MKLSGKRNSYFFLLWIIAGSLGISAPVFSQTQIKGRVIYEKDETPAAFATVELVNQKEGSLSDKSGNFSISISKLQHDDTLSISSVGYETLKIPVLAAMKRSEFVLTEKTQNLEAVTIFNTRHVEGSSSESVGYYRSWTHENTGGEIGRIFTLPYKQFKIDKIRFKVSNLCDTCLLRLHMRTVVDGKPGEEILKDSITLTINKLTLDNKVPEFDISAYDFTFTQNQFFVGIEVLNCRSKTPEPCTFCFAGTEKGKYIYKSKGTTEWLNSDDYTIHLKLFLRY